jgi:hypothetical protein
LVHIFCPSTKYQPNIAFVTRAREVIRSLIFAGVDTRVIYHGVTSTFFGIGILPVSDLFGGRYFRLVLLIWRELLFSPKGGLALSKRGLVPPFSSNRGSLPPALFEGNSVSRKKKSYRNVPTKISFGIDMGNTKKYRPIWYRPENTDSVSLSLE